MNILTVSASPYLLVRNARINSDIIEYFYEKGHNIASAVWHHDPNYFLPEEDGKYYYENKNIKNIQLFPFILDPENSSAHVYEIMKEFAPDIVISVGDYKETHFISSIKSMYPNIFKWIAICTNDTIPFNDNFKSSISYADLIITTNNFSENEMKNNCENQVVNIQYGPNQDRFYVKNSGKNKTSIPNILCTSKNSQNSNIGSLIKAIGNIESKFLFNLHTNIYDQGDYDIDLLLNRYNGHNNISIPEYYLSINDGISDEEMNNVYNKSDFFIDCSIKSSTAISMLEAMSTGCIPIGVNFGAIGEVLKLIPEEFRFSVDYNTFVGKDEEYFAIFNEESLRKNIEKALFLYNDDKIAIARESVIDISKQFNNKKFLKELDYFVKEIAKNKTPIIIESF